MVSRKALNEIAQWPNTTDVARQLAVSRQWVHKLYEAGELRGVKTRAGLLLDPESIEDRAHGSRGSTPGG